MPCVTLTPYPVSQGLVQGLIRVPCRVFGAAEMPAPPGASSLREPWNLGCPVLRSSCGVASVFRQGDNPK